MSSGQSLIVSGPVAALTALLGSAARAQDVEPQSLGPLVFVMAFAGFLVFFAYVASRLMRPAPPVRGGRVVPLPMVRRR